MKKKDNSIRVLMMAGDKEILSFKVSDFNDNDEINIALNSLVNVISGTLMAATIHALSTSSDSGSVDQISFATNKLFDVVAEHTRSNISDALTRISKIKKGGDA
jgi:hypothetical protein